MQVECFDTLEYDSLIPQYSPLIAHHA